MYAKRRVVAERPMRVPPSADAAKIELSLAEEPQQVGYEQDQQNGTQADTSAASIAPAAMAIVSTAPAKNQ